MDNGSGNITFARSLFNIALVMLTLHDFFMILLCVYQVYILFLTYFLQVIELLFQRGLVRVSGEAFFCLSYFTIGFSH